MEFTFPLDKSVTILAWKVKEGACVSVGHVLLSYTENGGDEKSKSSFKATKPGIVAKILAANGTPVKKGTPIMVMSPCTHPTVMRDMCAECGADLLEETDVQATASVAMIHVVPDLKISMEQAQILGKADETRLLAQKKLVLLVDLDQTLIHTTNDIVPQNLKDVFHFQLWGHGSLWYHTRLRPRTRDFLERISKAFELHICTFGTRSYAHIIARHLDPDGFYFSDRILSRDECFNQNSKTANLKELFPRGDHMVCIIDDREDVWNYVPNLIHVKPYHFFRHTGDINAPPGLAKKDDDDKSGFEFKKDGTCKKSVNSETPVTVPLKTSVTAASRVSTNVSAMKVKEVRLSDDEDSDTTDKEEKANEGDKEESGEEDSHKSDDSEDDKFDESFERCVRQAQKEEYEKAQEGKTDTESEEKPWYDISSTTVETMSVGSDSSGQSQEVKEQMEVEDTDDYLLYLEDILMRIHKEFYSRYDDSLSQGKSDVPDVKLVIPDVRHMTLKNTNLVFSGLVANAVPLKDSRPHTLAVALGANTSDVVIPPKSNNPSEALSVTTHVVAARMGTAKVNQARRYKRIQIVTPNWLWTCAERWEHVDERLFLMFKNKRSHRKHLSPVSMSSTQPESTTTDSQRTEGASSIKSSEPLSTETDECKTPGSAKVPAMRKLRTPSGRFMDTINPLLTFSVDEIAKMDLEVDDIFNEPDSSTSSEDSQPKSNKKNRKKKPKNPVPIVQPKPPISEVMHDLSSSSTSTSQSDDNVKFDGQEMELSSKKRKRDGRTETETEDEPLSAKFRRGEPLPSDLDSLNLTNASSDDDDNDERPTMDDWMGRELESIMDENSQD